MPDADASFFEEMKHVAWLDSSGVDLDRLSRQSEDRCCGRAFPVGITGLVPKELLFLDLAVVAPVPS